MPVHWSWCVLPLIPSPALGKKRVEREKTNSCLMHRSTSMPQAGRPGPDENTASHNSLTTCPRPAGWDPSRADGSGQGAEVSCVRRVTPNLLAGLATCKATPQLWPALPQSTSQPQLPLATRSPNATSGFDPGSLLQQGPASSWQAAGVCPGALDTAEFSHPLFTLPSGQVPPKSPVPTPVKDTVRKNLFGA